MIGNNDLKGRVSIVFAYVLGIRSMQDHGLKTVMPKRKKAAMRKKQFKRPRDNEHLAHVLENYEDNTLTQKQPSTSAKT